MKEVYSNTFLAKTESLPPLFTTMGEILASLYTARRRKKLNAVPTVEGFSTEEVKVGGIVTQIIEGEQSTEREK